MILSQYPLCPDHAAHLRFTICDAVFEVSWVIAGLPIVFATCNQRRHRRVHALRRGQRQKHRYQREGAAIIKPRFKTAFVISFSVYDSLFEIFPAPPGR